MKFIVLLILITACAFTEKGQENVFWNRNDQQSKSSVSNAQKEVEKLNQELNLKRKQKKATQKKKVSKIKNKKELKKQSSVQPKVEEIKDEEQVLENKLNFLALISTDYVSKTYSLIVETDNNSEITSIKTRNNKKNKIKTYKTELLNKEITLVKAVGVPLITLRCHNFSPKNGCPITIRYPNNITIGKFKEFSAEIKKVDGTWGLYANGRKFNELRLLAKKVLGLLIGIQKIELK